MSRPSPIDWRAARDALVRWATNATGLQVVWGNQNAPQPAWPYVSLLKTASPTPRSIHGREQWNADGELVIIGQREFGISMQVHVGPPDNVNPDCDGASIMEAALSTLGIPQTVIDFAAAGIALRDIGEPQPIDLVVGSEWINREAVDLRFGIVSVLDFETAPGLDGTGYFDKIRLSSTVDGIENPGGALELDGDLMDPNPGD